MPDVEEDELHAGIRGDEPRPARGLHLRPAVGAPWRPEMHDGHLRTRDDGRHFLFERAIPRAEQGRGQQDERQHQASHPVDHSRSSRARQRFLAEAERGIPAPAPFASARQIPSFPDSPSHGRRGSKILAETVARLVARVRAGRDCAPLHAGRTERHGAVHRVRPGDHSAGRLDGPRHRTTGPSHG